MKPSFSSFFFRPLFSGCVLLAVVGQAQESAPSDAAPVALDALVAEIVANNPELKFYEAEIDAAKAGHRSAGALADPELSVEAARKRVRDSSGLLAGEGTAWSVTVTQTFEWRGRLALRKSIANRQIELAELGLARFRAALVSRARVLAYGLQATAEKSAAAKEVAARYQTLRELFLARDPAGITPLLETRVIEAQELALKRRSTEAELAAQAALVELNQLRGAPFDAKVQSVGARMLFHSPPPLPELLTVAREKNFEFRMKRVELEQQGLEVSLARNERYPSVSVSPFYSQEKAGDRETVVGLGLSVPLPLSSRSRAGVDVAEARRRQAETVLIVAQRDLEREVITSYQTFQAKLAATADWKPDAAEKFREAAELADRHYRLGAVPLATYVELQNSYLEAVEALLDTKREALEAGQQLQLLTGIEFNAIEISP
jgi:cobalt-zinc-cadmium efflux system outer membrane protein